MQPKKFATSSRARGKRRLRVSPGSMRGLAKFASVSENSKSSARRAMSPNAPRGGEANATEKEKGPGVTERRIKQARPSCTARFFLPTALSSYTRPPWHVERIRRKEGDGPIKDSVSLEIKASEGYPTRLPVSSYSTLPRTTCYIKPIAPVLCGRE